MVFSSIAFILFFLPAVIWIYYLAPKRARNLVLLVSSLIFYTWGAGWLVAILIASIAANYTFGNRIERYVAAGEVRKSRYALGLAVVMNVGLLVWFQYAGFAWASFSNLLEAFGGTDLATLGILLPIGISFYTFHSLSYVVDVYRGSAQHLSSPIDFSLYITFFPQLIAGPIVRFHEIRDQLVDCSETTWRFAHGIYRFGHGLAKKVVIADSIAPVVNVIFSTPADQLNTTTALVGVVAYSVQLYFDFGGYTDMALGLGEMFGLRLPENFDRPYPSLSVTEFWRRWHMSLSRWFRDYEQGHAVVGHRGVLLSSVATPTTRG